MPFPILARFGCFLCFFFPFSFVIFILFQALQISLSHISQFSAHDDFRVSPEYSRELYILLHWVHRYLTMVVLVEVKMVFLEEVENRMQHLPTSPLLEFHLEPQRETFLGTRETVWVWTAALGHGYHGSWALPVSPKACLSAWDKCWNQQPAVMSPPMKTCNQVFIISPLYIFYLALCSFTWRLYLKLTSVWNLRVDSAPTISYLHFYSSFLS